MVIWKLIRCRLYNFGRFLAISQKVDFHVAPTNLWRCSCLTRRVSFKQSTDPTFAVATHLSLSVRALKNPSSMSTRQ